MPADDLGVLSDELRSRARIDSNGEVSWHVRDAPPVLSELAEAGRVVLGLDMRAFDDGSFIEVAWSVYNNAADPVEARKAALRALERDELPGDWALITLAFLKRTHLMGSDRVSGRLGSGSGRRVSTRTYLTSKVWRQTVRPSVVRRW